MEEVSGPWHDRRHEPESDLTGATVRSGRKVSLRIYPHFSSMSVPLFRPNFHVFAHMTRTSWKKYDREAQSNLYQDFETCMTSGLRKIPVYFVCSRSREASSKPVSTSLAPAFIWLGAKPSVYCLFCSPSCASCLANAARTSAHAGLSCRGVWPFWPADIR